MTTTSTRKTRLVRRTMNACSRRGVQFLRRASFGGVVAASVFAAGEASAIDIPPALAITADNAASSIGAQSITFTAGGADADRKLTLGALDVSTPNLLNERLFDGTFGDGNIDPINPATNANSFLGTTLTPVFTSTLEHALTYDGPALNGRTGTNVLADTVGGAWFGRITVGGGSSVPAGDITFATRSDDGSVIFVDTNNNGVFDAAELIVNNKGGHGPQNRAGSINLAAGTYNVAVAWYEGGSGEFIEAKFAPGVSGQTPGNTTNVDNAIYNTWTVINPTDTGQAGVWSIFGAATDPNFSANNVTLNANGTIEVDARPIGATRLGTITMAPGVTLTKTGGALTSPSTTITGAGTTTFNASGGRLTAGPLNTSGAAVNVVKSGTGALALAPSSSVGAGSTFNVSGGTLEISNNDMGVTSIAGSPVTLAGGTLAVTTKGVISSVVGPGLLEGRVPGAFNITDPNPGQFGMELGPVIAEVAGNTNAEPWPNNQTYVYTGQMFFPDNGVAGDGISEFAFAEHVDDSTQIRIDGIERLNSTVWNAVNTTGRLEVSSGWHDVEFRFGQGGGGYGPSTNTDADGDANNPWDVTLGFGVDFTSPIAGDFKQPNYVAPRDDGTGNLFRRVNYGPLDYASNVNVTENSVIQRSGGFVPQFGDLSIADGKSLTIRGSDVRFDNTNLAGTQTIVTEVNANIGRLSDSGNTGVTLIKSGAGNLDATNLANDLDGSAVRVQQGRFVVTNDNTGATSLDAAPVTLAGGTLELRSVVGFTQSHVGDGPFDGTFVEDVLEPGTTAGSNYLVFRDLNLEDFTLATTPLIGATARAPVNAIEIVSSAPGEDSIAIKLGANQPDGAGGDDGNSQVTGPAGVNSTASWNNFGAQNEANPQALNMDVNGTASPSGASVTWSSNGLWSSTGQNEENNTAPAGENRDLMAGYLDTGGLGGVGVTLNLVDLPASFRSGGGYDVYVYIKGGINGRGGDYSIRPPVFENPDFASNVIVTANSGIDVTGPGARLGTLSIGGGFTLTKTGSQLAFDSTSLTGNSTFNVTGDLRPGPVSDGANTTVLTKTGAGTLVLDQTNELNGTTININAGTVLASAANSLGGAVAVNLSNNAVVLRAGNATSLGATPITVDRSSFVDLDVAQSTSPKITVNSFGALIGKLGNISYGAGANQVSLANNAVLGPDAGETNLPAPGPAGHRLLLGIVDNAQTATHGGATSTGATDLYRGVAIGGWTPAGALAANLNGPATGDLNVHVVAPTSLLPGNLTFKNINPTATQLNSGSGVVNVLGQGRLIVNAGGDIGGSWTIMNRTGDPNFFGANNVLLELAGGGTPGTIGGGKTVNIRHGSLNLPGGGGANAAAVVGSVNILEGGSIIMDDAGANVPNSGIFNIAGRPGTTITDLFGNIVDINSDGVGNAQDVSAGPGAIYISQNNGGVLEGGGATYNVAEGFLLVIDADDITDELKIMEVMPKADIILDDQDRDNTNVTAGTTSNPFILGNGRRLTTTSNNNADINDDGQHTAVNARLIADPAIVGMAGARVILSAADGRQLDINDRNPQFAGVTLQIGDDEAFTTTEGSGGQSQAFDQIRVGRKTVPQGGRVRLAGVTADNIVVQSGVVFFEDNFAVTLGSTGNMTIEGGTVFIDDNAVHTAALTAGNWGRTGSEIRIEGGGALRAEFQQQAGVRNVAQTIRANGPGVAELIVDNGGGSGGTNVHLQNVILGNSATLAFGVDGATMSATVNATAGNGSIQNNISDTAISVNVNAGSQPITFTGSRLTQLASPVMASAINIGSGLTRSGRLSVANQAHLGSIPVNISPFSHLAFNPGTGNTVTPNLATITQGSGTLRAQSGTVDFGAGVLTGAVVTSTQVAGLHHSILPGSANLTEPNANVDVELGPLAATAPNLEWNVPFANLNTTHVYTGEFFDADGIVAFAEHFDDTVLLRVDGRTLLNNGAFNVATTSPDDDTSTAGLQTNIGAGNGGWHTFELRLGQGGGGAGAPGNQGGADWPFGTFGVGFNPNPGTSITNPTAQSNYQPMLDNGSMSLFRTSTDPGAGDLFVDGGATMRVGSFTGQDSLTLNGGASATANLTLLNATATNTLLRTSVNGLGAIDNPAGSTVATGALTTANNATLTKLGGGTLNINGVQSIGTGTTLAASAGTTNIGASFGGSNRLASLNVGAGATARITAGGVKNVVTNALSIAGGATPTGTLDLTDNAAIVDYPAAGPNPEATIRSQIVSGRGGTDLLGTWTGLGITSSAAAADSSNLSIGYANNADLPLGAYTTFRGEAVDNTTVLIRTTRLGDANLDGVVNDDDVTIVGATFGMTTGATWALGDFTYDGAVNDDDVTLIGALYNPAETPLPAPGASLVAGTVAAVPEPATWLMLTLGGLGAGLFGWRRRKA